MGRHSFTRVLSVALFLGLFGSACTHSGSGPRVVAPGGVGTVFSGRVTDQLGKPIADALVEVNGRSTATQADGTFKLDAARAERYVFNISHPEYTELSHITRVPFVDRRWTLVRAQTTTVDPTGPITLQDKRPELEAKGIRGATFTLAANSLVDPSGNPPAGPIRASIATLDIASGEAPGDWAVRSDDGRQDGYLVSYGAAFVQFTDATGKVKYQLRSGMTGQLSLPVIPSMSAHAPANPQARFWYYDTKDGYWKHNGNAVFNSSSGAYTGTVNHLSTLNTDIAKFDNAACLKITLDPSVAFGNKIRIRYHSGGTPFGQTPTFPLEDVDNAAWRLPAMTNVLLELLDPADVVFGNLIVEDPAGTPTINNVVNTGPEIPDGNTLWPGPPFTDCHAVLIRLGLPQVELRFNELPADVAPRDNPTDDYLTWAPTFSRARLSTPMGADVNVVLTNDPPGAIAGGGDVLFASFVSPWPVNTTATAMNVSLTLPADGSWVPFVIAGRFGFPSTNDKDTIVEAHLDTADGALIGTKPLMVRVRKNANNLTQGEKARYLFAWKKFRNQLGANYVRFQEMHRLTSTVNDQGHSQPAFLPWHRAMLLDVERELQKLEPSVALHYWDWDAAAPDVFADDFIGASPGGGGFSIVEPLFDITNPLNGWNTDLPFASGELRRNNQDHTAAPVPGFFRALDDPMDPLRMVIHPDYGLRVLGAAYDPMTEPTCSFSDVVEELSHNQAHGWPCGNGHVTMPVRSAADPLFYLLHSQIDRQWAYWQDVHARYGSIVGMSLTFPAPDHYDNNGFFDDPGVVAWRKGSFLEDGMWPWDGTTDGPPGRARRPVNQAPGPGTNIPLSLPVIPMTPFPASVRANLWPPVASVPRPKHMIDYYGRFLPQDGLGFCYDDVPY